MFEVGGFSIPLRTPSLLEHGFSALGRLACACGGGGGGLR